MWSGRVRCEGVGVVRQGEGEGEGVVRLRRWREHLRAVGRCDCVR